MNKYIFVTMPDGSQYKVPASIIAKNRAISYEKRKGEDYDEIYEETIEDDDEILDWARNNMSWDEVKEFAILKLEPCVDFDEGWINGYRFISEEN